MVAAAVYERLIRRTFLLPLEFVNNEWLPGQVVLVVLVEVVVVVVVGRGECVSGGRGGPNHSFFM